MDTLGHGEYGVLMYQGLLRVMVTTPYEGKEDIYNYVNIHCTDLSLS